MVKEKIRFEEKLKIKLRNMEANKNKFPYNIMWFFLRSHRLYWIDRETRYKERMEEIRIMKEIVAEYLRKEELEKEEAARREQEKLK